MSGHYDTKCLFEALATYAIDMADVEGLEPDEVEVLDPTLIQVDADSFGVLAWVDIRDPEGPLVVVARRLPGAGTAVVEATANELRLAREATAG